MCVCVCASAGLCNSAHFAPPPSPASRLHECMEVDWEPALAPSHALIGELWPLYRGTGERNGCVATSEAEFRELHLTTPNLCLMRIRVRAARPRAHAFRAR